MNNRTVRRTLAAAAVVSVGVLAGCSSGGGDASSDTFTWWDPYPQHAEGSAWDERVQTCGEAAGVAIQRTPYDTTSLTNQALLAAQEGTSPDVILLDNPAVSTLAETGMLSTVGELGLDTSAVDANLLAAGEVDGETYGIPIGANTLALYYNAEILDEAGIDPASITDWESLTAALEQVDGAGHRGITFAGINTEEGSFQFLPWFWGSGADLAQLDSPEAVEALELWTGWLDAGYAPNSVIGNSQNTTWEEFLTGDFAFVENGTWQVNAAAEADFETGVIELPARDGGPAPAPTGGEFVVAPVQDDADRYETTREIVECMTTPEGFVETAETFAYYIPPTPEGQEAFLADHPELETWVAAVQAAKGRTSDNLGTDYPLISEQLWTAVQDALSGSKTPQQALEDAQRAAEAATAG
ncbi:sugar ABC transporter substrate-binding protein [Zhihengliuella halotolerans]|uniref:Multiple sugar transport system substrate-binding protein n=1 Tax=Zhihengliuella halotolerans TaxID=370736 RepID=A0A4Q8AG81_9MICC|nr:extracellular solute-binding protein [Zhihengliuella halotolerans]RZU62755.1 multiple sugar transport system substrate-binding protein [Zhihengliuella halotolerans]